MMEPWVALFRSAAVELGCLCLVLGGSYLLPKLCLFGDTMKIINKINLAVFYFSFFFNEFSCFDIIYIVVSGLFFEKISMRRIVM